MFCRKDLLKNFANSPGKHLRWSLFSNKVAGLNTLFCRTHPVAVSKSVIFRGGSRTAATSKMECFVIIVNGWKPLTIITKQSILDVAAVLDPPLILLYFLCNNIWSENFLVFLKTCFPRTT